MKFCVATILNAAEYTPELAAGLAHTIDSLAMQLPLVHVITRREFLKYRLLMISKLEGFSGNGNHSRELTLTAELDQLTSEVRHLMSGYEAVFKREIQYNGKPYLDI